MIKKIKEFIKNNNLDGYIVAKNDKYFTEYSRVNNLAKVTNFTGSAGFALILKNANYLFVDGRYTLQANYQSGKNFKILEIPNYLPKNLKNIINQRIGFDPKLFTENILNIYFNDKVNLIPIEFNFNKKVKKKEKSIFKLNNYIVGESSIQKIKRVVKYLKKKK